MEIVFGQEVPRTKDLVVLEVKGAGGLEVFAEGEGMGSLGRLFLTAIVVLEVLVGVLRGAVAVCAARTAAVMVVVVVVVVVARVVVVTGV